VKGVGGGKTRALMEIREECLRREGVLPIVITFKDLANDSHWANKDLSLHFKYAILVVARMASVMFDISLEESRGLLISKLSSLLSKFYPPLSFIQEFVRYIEDRVNLMKKGRQVKNIIVM
jgi:hypothetical protein